MPDVDGKLSPSFGVTISTSSLAKYIGILSISNSSLESSSSSLLEIVSILRGILLPSKRASSSSEPS